MDVDGIRRQARLLSALLRPVFRRRLDAPYIARLIQHQSEKPKLLIRVDRDAVDYPRGDGGSARKTLQPNCVSYLQGSTEPYCTSLWVHEERHTQLGKGVIWIQTGKSNRNLVAYTSTAPDSSFLGP